MLDKEVKHVPRECKDYPGYYWCDKYPSIGVSKEGLAIRIDGVSYKRLGKQLYLGGLGLLVDRVLGSSVYIGKVICHVFHGPPNYNTTYKRRGNTVTFKDGDKSNLKYTNLEWVEGTKVDSNVDINNPITVESNVYPGFYVCNVFPSIGVNYTGETIRLDGRYKGTTSYGSGSSGYMVTRTYNHELKRPSCHTKVHRIVAYAFIGPPTTNAKGELQDCINHKDGDKINNCVGNLEWCTRAENNLDACISEYSSLYAVPVTVLDMDTGLVCNYHSAYYAGTVLGVRICTNNLSIKRPTVVQGRYQVLHYKSTASWLIYP